MHDFTQKRFTLVEIMVVVAIAIPNFTASRLRSARVVCIRNISAIEAAKSNYNAFRSVGAFSLTSLVESGDLMRIPTCPIAENTPYILGDNKTFARCPVSNQYPDHVYSE